MSATTAAFGTTRLCAGLPVSASTAAAHARGAYMATREPTSWLMVQTARLP